jgi:hypothetical protein
MTPSQVWAIEPFMCMQVAYYTFFLNYWTPRLPRYLAWEEDYFKVLSTLFVGLCLLGYDIWYWWIGMNLMKKTPGAPTLGLFVYWGTQDLFQWIYIPMRIILPIAALFLMTAVCATVAFKRFERHMNDLITPARLHAISEKWATDLETFEPTPIESLASDNLSPPKPSRRPSRASSHASSMGRPVSRMQGQSPDGAASGRTSPAPAGDWTDGKGEASKQDVLGAPVSNTPAKAEGDASDEKDPELRLRKTFTGRLKRHVLGWKGDEAANPIEAPAEEYSPKLEDLILAESLLSSLNKVHTPWWRWHYDNIVMSAKLVVALIDRGCRLRLLIAVSVYVRTLWSPACWQLQAESWPRVLLHAVNHPAYQTLSPEDVGLASRILLTLLKRGKFRFRNYFLTLYFWFGMLSLLVIGTELAIQWNHISGVQNLRTIGQLIPASIGVGGLTKVVYSAIFEKEEEVHLCFGKCHGDHRRKQWREACEMFERAEQAYERRMSPACLAQVEEV